MFEALWTTLRVLAARTLGALRPGRDARDFDEELAAHLEMAIDDKVRQGLDPVEARRRALVELGNPALLREDVRHARSLPWIGSSWLDLKLGLRMLRKSWGLTLVAGFAMVVVIGLGAVAFEVLTTLSSTDLPLDEGDRIVALQTFDLAQGDGIGATPADVERWRELRTLVDVGAFRPVERNLQTSAEGTAPGVSIDLAEISPSVFRLARVAPEVGRTLLPEDESPAADPVLVVGHRSWIDDFDADPGIVGRQVRLDGTVHTVVGVMPEGFAFPIHHRYWIPLRTGIGTGAYAPEAASDRLMTFARLADGATIEQAQSELRRVGQAPAPIDTVDGAKAAEIELRVLPYTRAILGDTGRVLDIALLVALLLLVPPSVNVAILVYARTITRQGEFAARTVLGASRAHIVVQLFLEILVLATCAGAVALFAARGFVWKMVENLRHRDEPLPFWLDFGLSPKTVLFVGLLAVFAALVAGVIPALRATGRSMQTGLKSLGGQPKQASLGAVWTSLIVLQVAVSAALLPISAQLVWGTVRSGLLGPGFAADQYLTAHLEPGRITDGHEGPERFAQRQTELTTALAAEPGVVAVAVSSSVPGEEPWLRVEKEAPGDPSTEAESDRESPAIGSSRVTRVNLVDEAFFDVFEAPLLAGRRFQPGDFGPAAHQVVVNRTFVDHVLGEGNPLGRRIRYRLRDGEKDAYPHLDGTWFEIVGVVADIHQTDANQAVFHPSTAENRPTTAIALRTRNEPTEAAGALRRVTWKVSPRRTPS